MDNWFPLKENMLVTSIQVILKELTDEQINWFVNNFY